MSSDGLVIKVSCTVTELEFGVLVLTREENDPKLQMRCFLNKGNKLIYRTGNTVCI